MYKILWCRGVWVLPSGRSRREVTLNSHLHTPAPCPPCSIPGALGFLCQPVDDVRGAVKAVPPSELEEWSPPLRGIFPVKAELPWQVCHSPGGLNSRKASAHSSEARRLS